jgi:WS/DGAT/MGAT family acyltransferase
VRVPLNSLHTTAHALGVTLNDIVLTAVGGGVARLLEQRGEARPPDIQVLVPVGLEPDHRESLDNRVSAWFVRVPLGPADPFERLHSVSRSSSRARVHHEEIAAEAVLDLASAAPQRVIGCVASLINHQPLFNLVVTNVPGPSDPLYLLGAAMVEAYPFVPLAGNLTIGVAAMSYDGYLGFGILADLVTCPDAATFARGLQDDLEYLAAATHR